MSMPTSADMTINRFKEIIASYGADSAHWPADDVRAMENLISTTPQLIDHVNRFLLFRQMGRGSSGNQVVRISAHMNFGDLRR